MKTWNLMHKMKVFPAFPIFRETVYDALALFNLQAKPLLYHLSGICLKKAAKKYENLPWLTKLSIKSYKRIPLLFWKEYSLFIARHVVLCFHILILTVAFFDDLFICYSFLRTCLLAHTDKYVSEQPANTRLCVGMLVS